MELERIKYITADVMNISLETITEKTRFIEDLGADSLDLYEIMIGLEEAFDLNLNPDQFEDVVTLKDAADVLKNVGR